MEYLFAFLVLILNFVWKADEGKAESIVLLIFILWWYFNRGWVSGGGRGRNSYSGPAEIISFRRWDFSRSNKHDTFWHVSRNSHQKYSIKKGVRINLTKFTGRYLLLKTYLKKRLWCRCFSVNFMKFLRAPFLQNISGQLLLCIHWIFLCFIFMSHWRFRLSKFVKT